MMSSIILQWWPYNFTAKQNSDKIFIPEHFFELSLYQSCKEREASTGWHQVEQGRLKHHNLFKLVKCTVYALITLPFSTQPHFYKHHSILKNDQQIFKYCIKDKMRWYLPEHVWTHAWLEWWPQDQDSRLENWHKSRFWSFSFGWKVNISNVISIMLNILDSEFIHWNLSLMAHMNICILEIKKTCLNWDKYETPTWHQIWAGGQWRFLEWLCHLNLAWQSYWQQAPSPTNLVGIPL